MGKPPDWVLEIDSASTGREDVGRKWDIYAHIGIPEYWRFDPSKESEYHGQKLAGDRLVDGVYEPIELTTAPDGLLKGYSEMLALSLCWDHGWPAVVRPGDGHLPDQLAAGTGCSAERSATPTKPVLLSSKLPDWRNGRPARLLRRSEMPSRSENERLREQLRRRQAER